ncbi:galactose-specific lectin nattectin-like [Haliotis rubra]|uniref:galactose-specific lectin nattectin-like n=1 Tax=Haliotis rubra TaxID=36100 RepID=UPI001EE53AAE|nr:galactose-specific lectin nattectin-like [Haliotis rubra]
MGVVLLITLLVFLPNAADGGRYQDCPEGWTRWGSKCFKLENKRFERSDAHWRCKHYYSASLAVIENEAENKVVQDLLGGQSSAWIGLRRKYGNYRWDDEYEYNYTNMASGRRTSGDCVRILSTGDWQRAYCFMTAAMCVSRNLAVNQAGLETSVTASVTATGATSVMELTLVRMGVSWDGPDNGVIDTQTNLKCPSTV